MAQYDIKTIAVRSDGFSIDMVFTMMSAGGVHNLGIGANGSIDNAKIKLYVTRAGFDNSGNPENKSITIYGRADKNLGAMRKVYPNQTSADETIAWDDLIVRYALSDKIYSGDIITADILTGLYTVSGNSNNSAIGINVYNNSVENIPRVVVNTCYPYQKYIARSNFDVEIQAYHKSLIIGNGNLLACVKLIVTDEHSHTLTYTITTPTVSTMADYNKITVYKQTVDVSTLTSGDLLQINYIVYPHWGIAIDSNDGANFFPTAHYANLSVRLYKNNEYGFAKVDATNGNDGTGVVYSSQSNAESGSAYQTIAGALTALQSYHNSNFSRNNAGGGYLLLTEDTHTLNTANGGTMTEWVTLTKVSTANRNNVIVQADANNADFPNYCHLDNIKFEHDKFYAGYGVRCFTFTNCIFNTTSGFNIFVYEINYMSVLHCTGTITGGFQQFSTYPVNTHIIRGNNFDNDVQCKCGIITGNNNVSIIERSNSGLASLDGGIISYNTNYATTNTSQKLSIGMSYDDYEHGVAIINNIFERSGSQVEPLVYIAGDGSTKATNNIIFINNVVAGARLNWSYNDTPREAPTYHKNWLVAGNMLSNANNKDDTFSEDADCIGGWEIGYQVGFYNNIFRTTATAEWAGEGIGINSIVNIDTDNPLDMDYVADNSADGANTGGGDYKTNSITPILHTNKIMPYDIEGTVRRDNGAIGAYEFPLSGITSLINGFLDSQFIGGLINV